MSAWGNFLDGAQHIVISKEKGEGEREEGERERADYLPARL